MGNSEKFDVGLVLRQIQNVHDMKIDKTVIKNNIAKYEEIKAKRERGIKVN